MTTELRDLAEKIKTMSPQDIAADMLFAANVIKAGDQQITDLQHRLAGALKALERIRDKPFSAEGFALTALVELNRPGKETK